MTEPLSSPFVRVHTAHCASYPQALTARAGTRLTLLRTDPEAPGWVWCHLEGSPDAWVPLAWLEDGHLVRDYSSQELTVNAGTFAAVQDIESGWAWLACPDGTGGWVPLSCLTAVPAELYPYVDSLPPFAGLRSGVEALLRRWGRLDTLDHCLRVGAEAERLAKRWGLNPQQAAEAGWLHDISIVVPTGVRADLLRALGVEVLPEEAAFPFILHQKLSSLMAQHLFGVQDEAVLSAVSCHTTLKPGSSALDQILFVADKIEWDQTEPPPYLPALLAACEQSPRFAAYTFLNILWQNRQNMMVIHPWFESAYQELNTEFESVL